MLKRQDRITVVADDDSWEIELRVMAAGRLYAQVEVLNHYKFRALEPREDSMYEIDYGGGHAKYRVMREGSVIRDGFESKADAMRWARSHEEALDR